MSAKVTAPRTKRDRRRYNLADGKLRPSWMRRTVSAGQPWTRAEWDARRRKAKAQRAARKANRPR